MAVTLRATLTAIQSYLQASARFDSVSVGEPLSAPAGISAAVLLSDNRIDALTLNSTIEIRTVVIRIYVSALAEPKSDTEFVLDETQAELIEDFCGDADLGTNGIRAIDVKNIVTRYGYQTIGAGGNNAIYRICDITLPLIVDDSAALSQ
jgi:hypothetical protein